MKIRTAKKILKHHPENDPIGHKFNPYWVKRWKAYNNWVLVVLCDQQGKEGIVMRCDHRISKAVALSFRI